MILLGGGIWAMVDRSGFKEIVAAHDLLHTAAYIIITVGSVLFIVGFMGCFGAIRENRPILMIFFVLILMIFLMEFICGILAFIFRKHLNEKYFLDELKDLYQGDNHTEVFTTTWNSIMITFSCCGVTGMDDFKEAVKFNALFPGFVVPEACCRRDIYSFKGKINDPQLCIKGKRHFINFEVDQRLVGGRACTCALIKCARMCPIHCVSESKPYLALLHPTCHLLTPY
uniref:Tetraspanin 18 n=1 Tax=Callorhinchus milii TaxID=7868 RepID=A0A4W3H2N7_CALMI